MIKVKLDGNWYVLPKRDWLMKIIKENNFEFEDL